MRSYTKGRFLKNPRVFYWCISSMCIGVGIVALAMLFHRVLPVPSNQNFLKKSRESLLADKGALSDRSVSDLGSSIAGGEHALPPNGSRINAAGWRDDLPFSRNMAHAADKTQPKADPRFPFLEAAHIRDRPVYEITSSEGVKPLSGASDPLVPALLPSVVPTLHQQSLSGGTTFRAAPGLHRSIPLLPREDGMTDPRTEPGAQSLEPGFSKGSDSAASPVLPAATAEPVTLEDAPPIAIPEAPPTEQRATLAEGPQIPDDWRPSSPLRIFDSTLYSGKPENVGEWLEPMPILYAPHLWPTPDKSELPPLDRLRALASEVDAEHVCINIEHWAVAPVWLSNYPDVKDLTPEKLQQNRERLAWIADRVKEVNPEVEVGYWDMMPPGYGRNLDAPSAKAVEAAAPHLDSLGDHVDMVMPSLYPRYDNTPEEWRQRALKTIRLAKRYDKPVYLFVSTHFPHYHDNIELRNKPIPAEWWPVIFATAEENATGLVFWSPPQPWDEDAPWWVEVQKYLKERSLRSAGSYD